MVREGIDIIKLFIWYLLFIVIFNKINITNKCSTIVQQLFNKKQQRKGKERKVNDKIYKL